VAKESQVAARSARPVEKEHHPPNPPRGFFQAVASPAAFRSGCGLAVSFPPLPPVGILVPRSGAASAERPDELAHNPPPSSARTGGRLNNGHAKLIPSNTDRAIDRCSLAKSYGHRSK
jgi:hypothetical protein